MTILEMCLEKLFDKNEEIVRLVYCPPRGGGVLPFLTKMGSLLEECEPWRQVIYMYGTNHIFF